MLLQDILERSEFTVKHDTDGTPVKVYPPGGPKHLRSRIRANVRAFGSRHIGGSGDTKKSRVSGVRAANTQGVPVITQKIRD